MPFKGALEKNAQTHPGAAIEPPFYCDYGTQITLGGGSFVNFGAVFLDPGQITIGGQSQLGPYVQLLTADHPRDAAARAAGPESAQPINIGARVWLGAGNPCRVLRNL